MSVLRVSSSRDKFRPHRSCDTSLVNAAHNMEEKKSMADWPEDLRDLYMRNDGNYIILSYLVYHYFATAELRMPYIIKFLTK